MKFGPFLTVFIALASFGSVGVPLVMAQTTPPPIIINADDDDPGGPGATPVPTSTPVPTATPTPCPTGQVPTCQECLASPTWCNFSYPGRLLECSAGQDWLNPTPWVYSTPTVTPTASVTPSGTITPTATPAPDLPRLVEVYPGPGEITLYNATGDTIYVEVDGLLPELVKGPDADDLIYPDGETCYEVVVAIRWTVAATSDTMRWRALVDDDTDPYTDAPLGWSGWRARTNDKLAAGDLQQINIGCGDATPLTVMDNGFIYASVERYNGSDPAAQAEIMYYSYWTLAEEQTGPVCQFFLGPPLSEDNAPGFVGYELHGDDVIFLDNDLTSDVDMLAGVRFLNPGFLDVYPSAYVGSTNYSSLLPGDYYAEIFGEKSCLEDDNYLNDEGQSPCEWYADNFGAQDHVFNGLLACPESEVCAFTVGTSAGDYLEGFNGIYVNCVPPPALGCVADGVGSGENPWDWDWPIIRDTDCLRLVPRIDVSLIDLPVIDDIVVDIPEVQVCFEVRPDIVLPLGVEDIEISMGFMFALALILTAVSLVIK